MKNKTFVGRCRSGGAMLMTLGVAIFLIGMTALVTDVGWYYYNKVRLETAVNASWKAGFDHIHEIQGYNNRPLSAEQKALVEQRVREIAAFNGLTPEQVAAIEVIIGPRNELEVRARHDVGLFFAKVADNQISMSVSAERSDAETEPVYVAPLAIPHGVVKDLSRRTYDVTMFPDPDPELANSGGDCTRFMPGVEYILKLGTGEGVPEQSRILVPMGPGDQSTWGYRRAYGAAYWCLAISENDGHFGPVHWLLGYRGGAFLLIDVPEVRQILTSYGVYFEIITGNDNINAIYDIVGENVMEVWDRPRIAVYSSTSSPDPVEETLRNARIPYGPYSLPGEWPRNESFQASRCSSFYDEAVLSGEIDKYHWLHLHHEDFTGFSGGCRTWKDAPDGNSSDPHCRQNYLNGLYGSRNNTTARTAAREYFCDKCYDKFNPGSGDWHSNVVPWGVVPHKDGGGNNITTPDFGYIVGATYNLKNSPSNGGLITPGNFGALNLVPTFAQGGGANIYQANIQDGYGHPISVGQRYYPQTGNITGPTNTGVSYRISNNKRDVIVPVVDRYGNGSSSRSRILGFLNFRLIGSHQGDVTAVYLGASYENGYDGSGSVVPYVPENCRHYQRRCAEFATHIWWKRHEEIKPGIPGSEYNEYLYRYSPRSQVRNYICYSDDTRPNCRGYNRIFDIATDFGFTDDPGSVPKPKARVFDNGNLSLDIHEPNWFDSASRVQKMKWQVANIIKDHVQAGGFLFAQCFAPETFDLALFQSEIYAGKSNAEAYQHTLAFGNFEYHAKPYGNIPLGYSAINTREYPGNQPFNLLMPFDPRTQNHGTPDTRTGHTAAFNSQTVKPSTTILGRRTSNANRVKYVGGELGDGVFAFLGGHHMGNVEAERLVLNNILFGSLSKKEVTEGSNVPMAGRTKHSYGPIDPTNKGTTPEDYTQMLMYGFNSPLQINDRISGIPEQNLAQESHSAVEYRVAGSLEEVPLTSRRVIVPITDVGPEIAINSPENADAIAIYDMVGADITGGKYSPAEHNFTSSVRIIGFAEFELLLPDEYTRAGTEIGDCHTGDLGSYQTGQIRGIFIRYIVNPHEVANLLQ